MKLKVLSFSGENFSHNDVISVRVMTKSWEITVLEWHAPTIAVIEPCVLSLQYKNSDGEIIADDFAIGKGVIEINVYGVIVLADMLIDIEEINQNEVKEAKQRALDLMQEYKNTKDHIDMQAFIEAEDMLLKSIAQLKLYDLKK